MAGTAQSRVKDADEGDGPAADAGFFQGLAHGAFGGRLADLEGAAGHGPLAVVGPLDEKDLSLVVDDSGITAGEWGGTGKDWSSERLDLVERLAADQGHHLHGDGLEGAVALAGRRSPG